MADARTGPETDGWRAALSRELTRLDRWIDGRFAETVLPDAGFVPASRYLDDPGMLREVIIGMCLPEDVASGPAADPDIGLPISVSRFARQYCASLTSVAQVALARGVGLDVSASRCAVAVRDRRFLVALDLDGTGIARCAERPTTWPVSGPRADGLAELREHVWSRLYGAHLAPLFEAVLEVVPKVAPALLWTNAAEYVGMVSDAAEEYLTPEEAEPYVADRRALLETDSLPGVPGPNPLRGMVEWVPTAGEGFPGQVQTRRMCCLNYLLPDRDGRLCQNCPHLPLDDRVALVRERHGRPVGAPGGAADRRAREVGRLRPSFRRRSQIVEPTS